MSEVTKSSTGTLTYECFVAQVKSFLNAANCVDKAWELKTDNNTDDVYLVKLEHKKDSYQEEECSLTEDSSDSGDPQALHTFEKFLQMEYHIVYSRSYCTPVLYFLSKNLDGSLLRVEQVWQRVSCLYKERQTEADQMYKHFGNMITQMEHPILRKPYFAIHPCNTANFMKSLLNSEMVLEQAPNYIMLWLSTIGPIVGLTVDMEYVKYL